jgi:GTPase SAR1 family protein
MWDTIGLEVGKDLSLKISSKANCAVFVFDITNKQSFENLNEYIIKYKKICDNNNKKFYGLVFGNKCDKQNREVNLEEAQTFSIKYGMKYYEVNALNDRKSLGVIIKAIEELLNTVMKEQKIKK